MPTPPQNTQNEIKIPQQRDMKGWPTTLGQGACSRVRLICPAILHWRKLTSSPGRYQLQVASCLGWDILSPSPFLSWYCYLAWICTWAHCPRLWKFICVSLLFCLEDTVSFQSLTSFDSYSLSTSSSASSPEPWWEKLDESIPFRTACCQVSHSLCTVWCVSVLIPS